MQLTLPIPEGLKLPQSGKFEIPVALEAKNGELYVIAVAGRPVSGTAETEGEMPEEEAPEQPMGEEGAPKEDMASQEDFLSAIENSLKKKA